MASTSTSAVGGMKRKADSEDRYQDMVSRKTIKLSDNFEVEPDAIISKDSITEEITGTLAYDYVMNQFIITLQKESGTKLTSVTFTEWELVSLTEKFPVAIAVGKKYEARESGSIDIPFELTNNKTGGTAAVLFVRDSGYSKTGIVIDIRKCGKNSSSGGFFYTKQGVRFGMETAQKVECVLRGYIRRIDENVKKNGRLLETAECCILTREIKLTEKMQTKSCNGCITDHPSQRQHMGFGGCMTEWAVTVFEYWGTARAQVEQTRIIEIAETAARYLPDTFGLVKSCRYPLLVPSEDELKDAIISQKLVNDEAFTACESACELFHKNC